MRLYTDYDPFAWLYANHWGAEYHEQGYAVLDRLLLRRLPYGASILDLCCGDGRLTQALDLNGYRVVGLDGSSAMLEFARERCPNVTFLHADARTFATHHRFDAVISTFDALNHLMTPADLDSVCERVFAALEPGGWFAFDLNREEAYTELWARTSTQVEPDMVSVAVGFYEEAQRVAHCDITLFLPAAGRWIRSDFRLSQFCHRQEDVERSLAEAGFVDIAVFDAATGLGMAGNIGQGRNYYLARRPV